MNSRDIKAVKLYVLFAVVLAVLTTFLRLAWETRYDWLEPLGGSTWKVCVGYLAGSWAGVIQWLDTHQGTTAFVLGMCGVIIQGFSVYMKYRTEKKVK